MRANVNLFWILAGFFLLVDVVYIVWNLVTNAQQLATQSVSGPGTPIEWVGTIALGLCAVLAAFIAFYLSRVYKAQAGALPEDNVNASIDDGDPELGFYSPFSWWPIVLAAALGLLFLGLAVGIWVSIIGVGIGLIALVGWTYEYYRGFFAR
ncbi:cytochrome c oxidase subunit 4 [Cryobacterium adonitolivorans]|uniref:cytochrome-c oxidase n=1 Tax=Cryobacterium adonitolivorans TaxID=1259189 RepID=A0A4R8W9J5_9MICO|nr:cytochrome c oxidase subunit 4 [Cryobacterium adonitolivorans]TFC04383.1 cytochrome c oxidase subunit 4 [Cryobacterium adonitolivorans]